MHKIERKVFNIGIIGLGKQAHSDHIPAVLESNEVRLIAVCDVKKDIVKEVSEKYKVKGYTDALKMLKNENLDIVILALPHHEHCNIVRAAIDKGVHIIKEKPFSIDMESAKKIAALSKKKKVHIITAVQRRFNPIFSTFFQLIGKIGKPCFFDANYTFYTDCPHTGWRGSSKLAGGGCLIDMGYHIVDLLVWYFGVPDQVFAETSANGKEDYSYDAEDSSIMICRYNKKNMWGKVFLSRIVAPKTEVFKIIGTRGSIVINRGSIERYSADGELQEKLSRENSWPSAFTDQIDYMTRILRDEEKNLYPADYHLQHMAIITAAYESKQKKTYIDPHKYL